MHHYSSAYTVHDTILESSFLTGSFASLSFEFSFVKLKYTVSAQKVHHNSVKITVNLWRSGWNSRRHWGSAAARDGELEKHSLDAFRPSRGRSLQIPPSFMQHQKSTIPTPGLIKTREYRHSACGLQSGSDDMRVRTDENRRFSFFTGFPPGSASERKTREISQGRRCRSCESLWRRRRDLSGATGAVSPPARGTKKPFTGRFFAVLRPAVPFKSLPLLCTKKAPYSGAFHLAQRKGFEPLLRFPVNTISNRAPSASSAISASRLDIIHHFVCLCK